MRRTREQRLVNEYNNNLIQNEMSKATKKPAISAPRTAVWRVLHSAQACAKTFVHCQAELRVVGVGLQLLNRFE